MQFGLVCLRGGDNFKGLAAQGLLWPILARGLADCDGGVFSEHVFREGDLYPALFGDDIAAFLID